MGATRFKVFASAMPHELELLLNKWAETLPPGTKIRRTQLAGRESGWAALVNYEASELSAAVYCNHPACVAALADTLARGGWTVEAVELHKGDPAVVRVPCLFGPAAPSESR